MPGLNLHIYADKSDEASLQNDLPGAPPGTWPLDRVEHIGEPPEECNVSMHVVLEGLSRGYIEGEGHEVVTRPGGPAGNKWLPTTNCPTPHNFHHFTHLTIAGVRYEVTHQPDKYADDGDGNFDDDEPVTDELYDAGQTRVDWFYSIKKVNSDG
jgi:hypothetical protein